MPLLHDTDDYATVIEVVADDMAIDPALVEKDYWIMHVLWGLQQLGMTFELKGGTSLSKGYGLSDRFSENIDILIHPVEPLPTGRNHNKPAHVEQRRAFFDGLVPQLSIPGVVEVLRDLAFDNDRLFSAGIRLIYPELTPLPPGLKAGCFSKPASIRSLRTPRVSSVMGPGPRPAVRHGRPDRQPGRRRALL